ncbi:G/U mismatch-specific uracil-DNA glycosylase [Cruoricaptor ignavus]|uniref:G/U mismatch-specific uracil-DNA glycosylase n=1 Tax=Cruoricaptor ignavus TaxID=1118202 RepID=A0A1M6EAE6_9FLAO|nr:DNA-deoxyinosine glycosylase [Cruoricaptor ignavus]SHI82456.1 G/U mismatch-specific uracil-DNA glycosylase [Cruoricaptor ignavus]
MSENRVCSFPPIIFPDSKILILGSMPGVKSLEMQQYYAHPQNKFWKILFAIFGEEFTTDYELRKEFLAENKIAVWDTIESCTRKGSLDADIRNEEANKIRELLENHPQIRAIYCNGQKSFANTLKLLGKDFRLPIFAMPSTSPANASIPYQTKLERWKGILEFV